MSVELTRRECGKGMSFTKIYDKKFKTFGLSVRMIVPYDDEYSPVYPLVLDILATCTRRYPEREQFSKVLTELYSASVSTNSARVGKYLMLRISLNCLCDEYTIGKEKISAAAAQLLIDCLTDPYIENGMLSEKYMKLCKSDLLDDIDALINNKRRYAAVLARKRIFNGELTARSPLDEREALSAVDCRTVTDAYHKLLKTAFYEISVTGGSCDDAVTEMLIGSLSSFERDPIVISGYEYPSPLKQEVCRDEEYCDANQCQLIIAYKSEEYNEYADKLFLAMLGSTPMSKLFMNVREKMSLCYFCDAMIIDLKNTIVVTSGLDAENLSLAEQAIADQIKAMQEGDFSDEELENAKLYLSEAYLSNYDSKYDILMWYYYQFMHGTCDSPEEKGVKINALTREDVIRTARNYKLDTVFVLKAKEGDNAVEA